MNVILETIADTPWMKIAAIVMITFVLGAALDLSDIKQGLLAAGIYLLTHKGKQ